MMTVLRQPLLIMSAICSENTFPGIRSGVEREKEGMRQRRGEKKEGGREEERKGGREGGRKELRRG